MTPPPTVEILAIGNELLRGEILDTNTQWLCRLVTARGGRVGRVTLLADVEAEIAAAVPRQDRHLGWALAGHGERPGWWGAGRTADWSDAIAIGVELAAALGSPVEVARAERPPFHPGRCARYALADGTVVARVRRQLYIRKRRSAVVADRDPAATPAS